MDLAQIVGLFNIGTGILFVLSLLYFVGGFTAWLTMLGLEKRSVAVDYMTTGVEMMFVLIVLLYAVQMFQKHAQIATALVAFGLIAVIAWHIVPDLMAGDAEKKPEAKPAKK